MSNTANPLKDDIELANLAASFREVVEAKLVADPALAEAFDGSTTDEDRTDLVQKAINVETLSAVVKVALMFGTNEDMEDLQEAVRDMAPASIALADCYARLASRVMDTQELSALMPMGAKEPHMRERFMAKGAANLAKLCRPK